jgi:hypothetical protein
LDGKHLPPVPDAPTGDFTGSSTPNDATFGASSEETFKSLLMGSGFTEYGAVVEEDVDGGPVVGDYLKMMFVEHSVVPTILVCGLSFPSKKTSNVFRTFSSDFLGTISFTMSYTTSCNKSSMAQWIKATTEH